MSTGEVMGEPKPPSTTANVLQAVADGQKPCSKTLASLLWRFQTVYVRSQMPNALPHVQLSQEAAHLFAEVAKGGGQVLPQSRARAGGRARACDRRRLVQRCDDHLQGAWCSLRASVWPQTSPLACAGTGVVPEASVVAPLPAYNKIM